MKLKDVSAMPKPAVYRRSSKGLYVKLNEGWQVPVVIEKGRVIGNGMTEEINPEEDVVLV